MSTVTTGRRGGDVSYNARKTLPLRVEFVRQLRRRRTWIAFVVLLLLPWILAAAFKIGGAPSGNDPNTPGLVTVATAGALNFTAFTLFVSVGFLLVVAVALFCGDTVASEAGWASLRYLLAAPVPRVRLLRQKLIVAMSLAALAVLSLPVMAMITGIYVFGWARLRLPATDAALPNGTALTRLLIIVGYTLVSELVVAALAFLLSVTTDSPLGAVGGAVGLVILSNIIDAVTALGHWREFLPTHWTFAWTDALQPQMVWTGMIEGMALSASYAIVLLALAVRRFRNKDIVS
jgi:ABC-type transport system involved in multi-copper enzyme maturation permease subunit